MWIIIGRHYYPWYHVSNLGGSGSWALPSTSTGCRAWSIYQGGTAYRARLPETAWQHLAGSYSNLS